MRLKNYSLLASVMMLWLCFKSSYLLERYLHVKLCIWYKDVVGDLNKTILYIDSCCCLVMGISSFLYNYFCLFQKFLYEKIGKKHKQL